MFMRASGASERRKFRHFDILKEQFLSIFCRYFRYFVGTPPPPPLATLVDAIAVFYYYTAWALNSLNK